MIHYAGKKFCLSLHYRRISHRRLTARINNYFTLIINQSLCYRHWSQKLSTLCIILFSKISSSSLNRPGLQYEIRTRFEFVSNIEKVSKKICIKNIYIFYNMLAENPSLFRVQFIYLRYRIQSRDTTCHVSAVLAVVFNYIVDIDQRN